MLKIKVKDEKLSLSFEVKKPSVTAVTCIALSANEIVQALLSL